MVPSERRNCTCGKEEKPVHFETKEKAREAFEEQKLIDIVVPSSAYVSGTAIFKDDNND